MEKIQQKKLPRPDIHPLLPRPHHVHLFAKVVLVVVGGLSLLAGVVLYALGFGEVSWATSVQGDLTAEQVEVFFYLGAALLMGFGVTSLLVWLLWHFIQKNRYRFLVSVIVSTVSIIAGVLSVVGREDIPVVQYTFYFFALTLGLLIGMMGLFYFFLGFARHVFPEHGHTLTHGK